MYHFCYVLISCLTYTITVSVCSQYTTQIPITRNVEARSSCHLWR
jgi:hypothetical protein